MKQRDISIDILKFIAAIIITNSHMELLYGEYSMLATGGAIGDVLFFFCSGFTLFMGNMDRFDNWYKRRINRIYPTVFAWAIIGASVFGIHEDMKWIIFHGGGWFVSCIMIYYIILWFIRRYMQTRLWTVFTISVIAIIVWYLCIEQPAGWSMYGTTYFKWGHYFLFMLIGAIIGQMPKQNWKFSFWKDTIKLFACIIAFYAILIGSAHYDIIHRMQIVSLIPLLGITYYFYKVCNSDVLKKCYYTKVAGWCIKFISSLCLEIYIVQGVLFTDAMNSIFPLNILLMFIVIFISAYLLRCLARIFSQTFKDENYNWKKVFQAY